MPPLPPSNNPTGSSGAAQFIQSPGPETPEGAPEVNLPAGEGTQPGVAQLAASGDVMGDPEVTATIRAAIAAHQEQVAPTNKTGPTQDPQGSPDFSSPENQAAQQAMLNSMTRDASTSVTQSMVSAKSILGPSFLKGLSETTDQTYDMAAMLYNAMNTATRASAGYGYFAATGQVPPAGEGLPHAPTFGEPGGRPMRDWLNRQGFATEPPPAALTNEFAYDASKFSEMVGAALPFMLGGWLAMGAKGLATVGLAATAKAVGKSMVTQPLEAGLVGLGGAAAGEAVSGGQPNTVRGQLGEAIGNLVLAPRLPILAAMYKRFGMIPFMKIVNSFRGDRGMEEVARTLFKNNPRMKEVIAEVKRNMQMMPPGAMPTTASLTNDDIISSLEFQRLVRQSENHADFEQRMNATRQAVERAVNARGNPLEQEAQSILRGDLQERLDEVDRKLAAVYPEQPSGKLSASAEAQREAVRSELLVQTLRGYDAQMSSIGRILWAKVDLDAPRDITGLKDSVAKMAAEWNSRHGKMASDFPRDIEHKLLGDVTTETTSSGAFPPYGVVSTRTPAGAIPDHTTLGDVHDLYSTIQADIRAAQAGTPPNRELIRNLAQIRDLVLNVLGRDTKAAVADDAFNTAMNWTRMHRNLVGEGPIFKVLNRDQLTNERVSPMLAIQQFLMRDQKGYVNLAALLDMTRVKDPNTGALLTGTDAINASITGQLKAMWREQVAPDGWIDAAAHNRFMDHYGGVLAHYPDVERELNDIGDSGRSVDNLLNYTKQWIKNDPGAMTKAERMSARAALYLDQPVATAVEEVVNSPVSMVPAALKRVFGALAKDPTGRAAVGFSSAILQRSFSKSWIDDPIFMPNHGVGVVGSSRMNGQMFSDWWANHKPLAAEINRYVPGFSDRLQRVTNAATAYEKMQNSRAIVDTTVPIARLGFIGQLVWSLVGAKLGGRLAEQTGASFVMAGRGAAGARMIGQNLTGWLDRLTGGDKLRVLDQVLLNPEKFVQLKDLPSAAQDPQKLKALNYWLISIGVPPLQNVLDVREQEKELGR